MMYSICRSLSYTKLILLKILRHSFSSENSFSTLDSATCPSAERVHQFLLDHFVLFLTQKIIAKLLSIVSNFSACCMSDQFRTIDMRADILPLTADATHGLCSD